MKSNIKKYIFYVICGMMLGAVVNGICMMTATFIAIDNAIETVHEETQEIYDEIFSDYREDEMLIMERFGGYAGGFAHGYRLSLESRDHDVVCIIGREENNTLVLYFTTTDGLFTQTLTKTN